MNQTKRFNISFLFIFIALFYLYLIINTPLTGDDWTWGTDRGIARLKAYFVDYNGRYVSNILEILSTRSDLFRYFIHVFFSTLLIYLMGRLMKDNNKQISYLLSFILILLIPTKVFGQTFGWTAGFVNYVPSVVLLLLFLVIVKNMLEHPESTFTKFNIIVLALLGLITQLFVEHVTLFVLFTSIVTFIYVYKVNKKVYMAHIIYIITVLLGAIIMFSNSAYWKVLSGTDEYRSVSYSESSIFNLLHQTYAIYSADMYRLLFTENIYINVLLGIMVILLLFKAKISNNILYPFLKYLFIIIITGFLIYITFMKNSMGDIEVYKWLHHFGVIFSILYFLSIIGSVLLFVSDKSTKIKLVFYLSGVILMSAPFIFVTPYGPRAALSAIIFLIITVIELYHYNKRCYNWNFMESSKLLMIIATILAISYIYVFTVIGYEDRKRMNHLHEQIEVGAEEIHLNKLPYSHYMWMSSPPRKHFNNMFKRFYDVPEETKVIFDPIE